MTDLWQHYTSEVKEIVEFFSGMDEVPGAVRTKEFLPAIRALESKDLNERQKVTSQNERAGRPGEPQLKSSWISGEWTMAEPQQIVISPLHYDPGLFPHLVCAHDLVRI